MEEKIEIMPLLYLEQPFYHFLLRTLTFKTFSLHRPILSCT